MMTPDRITRELTARLDGPHGDEHTAAAAWLAAESVRFLNYATGSHAGAGLTYPATAYAVTGALGTAAGRMDQLASQLCGFLDRELAAGRLGEDQGRDPAGYVTRARGFLAAAGTAAGALSAALNSAQAEIGSLHHKDAR